MKVSIIAAIDEKRGIGKHGKLPWHISADLQRFKKLTFGHTIIMGRRTFQSIGHPLIGRKNIILTRNLSFYSMGCLISISIKEALQMAKDAGEDEVFIIGGADIFDQGIQFADQLYLTIIQGDFGADVFFPDYSLFTRKIIEEEHEEGEYKFKFLTLGK
jgi:dihydrofolate reductase